MDEQQIADYVARFARDGFVHARGVIPVEEVAAFRAAVDQAVASRKVNDTRKLDEKSLYEQSFIQCQNLWEDWPDVRALTFHPAITSLAARLIGAGRLRLWHDQALYKEPGGRDTDAHQDHPYWPIVEDLTLTAWIPLMEITDETGCMGYVPGSHRGPREFINIFTDPGSGMKLLAKFDAAPHFEPCKPGDVLYHHGFTAHLAKPNRSSATRCVHTAIYFADGCTRGATPKHHPSVDRAGIEIGSTIASGVTPIAWPLDNGLPSPVPWPDNERTRALQNLGIIPQHVK